MNKNQVWKLFFVLLIIFISLGLISPFEDRELGKYALGQVTSDANTSNHVGYETFDEVIETHVGNYPMTNQSIFVHCAILVPPTN